MDTLQDVVNRLPRGKGSPLKAPARTPAAQPGSLRLALAVASMRQHMTDEGWQIMDGLRHAGYTLAGYGLPLPETNVQNLLREMRPATVLMQDKREWDVQPGNFRDGNAKFKKVWCLAERPEIFKLTIVKDAHHNPGYHAQSAADIGCHAWVTYYATPVVTHLAPYIRPHHVVRTYHTLDPACVPPYTPHGRVGCLLSGAVSAAYPLRIRLVNGLDKLPDTFLLRHPGYHRRGCATPEFLQMLSRFKVAICTASVFGYALRKIMEATACGCVVVTDLPQDEVLPEIDGNLVRVPHGSSVEYVAGVVRRLSDDYVPERQAHYAKLALARYDYRVETARLADCIEQMRLTYGA